MNWESGYLQFKSRSALDSIKANELRQKAFDQFIAQGLPSKKEEAWKFTSLNNTPVCSFTYFHPPNKL